MYCMRPDGSTIVEVSCDTPDALVVVTRLELQHYSPFYLDPKAAVEIGGSILFVMAVAFVLRMARKALETEEKETI